MGHPRFDELLEEEQKLHKEKNDDYTHQGEPLGNFNRVSKILALYPELRLDNPTVVAVAYMLKQLDAALWMLNSKYEGQIEGFESRMKDVSVYAKLMVILREETNDYRS